MITDTARVLHRLFILMFTGTAGVQLCSLMIIGTAGVQLCSLMMTGTAGVQAVYPHDDWYCRSTVHLCSLMVTGTAGVQCEQNIQEQVRVECWALCCTLEPATRYVHYVKLCTYLRGGFNNKCKWSNKTKT